MPHKVSPNDHSFWQLDKTAELMDLDPTLHNTFLKPHRALEVSVLAEMDGGECGLFAGYRIQHSLYRGVTRSRINCCPDVTRERWQCGRKGSVEHGT